MRHASDSSDERSSPFAPSTHSPSPSPSPLMAQKGPAVDRVALAWLSALHTLRCVSDRSWAFLLPLHLSSAFPGSMYEVSVISVMTTMVAVLLMPRLALWLRQRRGLHRFNALLACENASVLAAGVMLIGQGAGTPIGPAFYLAGLLLALDKSCEGVLENLVVKEWTSILVVSAAAATHGNASPRGESRESLEGGDGGDSVVVALSSVNSLMSQIDLAVGVAVPFGVSILLEAGTSDETVILLLLWHVVSAALIAALAAALCSRVPECATSPKSLSGMAGDDELLGGSVGESLEHAWAEFSSLPRIARRNVVAYVLLFVSVVSPSGLTVAWLRANSVSVRETAALRSAVQLSGFAGTLAAPRLIARLGLEAAAPASQGLQTFFVTLACGACLGGAVRPFMLALVCSRFGLWAYDLCERQLVQHGAKGAGHQSAQLVFAAERCGAQLMTLVMSALAMTLPSTDDYGTLVIVSTLAVVGAHAIIQSAAGSTLHSRHA